MIHARCVNNALGAFVMGRVGDGGTVPRTSRIGDSSRWLPEKQLAKNRRVLLNKSIDFRCCLYRLP